MNKTVLNNDSFDILLEQETYIETYIFKLIISS